MAKRAEPFPLTGHDDEAFEVFCKERKFTRVAKRFKVSAMAVSKHAEKHEWIDRLSRRIAKIEEKTNEKLSDRLARDAHRHFDIMSLIEANAINALKKPNLANGEHMKPVELAQTAGAVETSVKTKRLIVGESTENVAFSYKDWMRKIVDIAAGEVKQVDGLGSKGGNQ